MKRMFLYTLVKHIKVYRTIGFVENRFSENFSTIMNKFIWYNMAVDIVLVLGKVHLDGFEIVSDVVCFSNYAWYVKDNCDR